MFIKHDSFDPHGGPVLVTEILANSITVTQNDSVKFASGFVALGTAGAAVLGHVADIVTDRGVGLSTTGAAGAEAGSFIGTFTTTSDNQTVAKVSAVIDVSQQSRYSADVDATLGTTTGSGLRGYRMDLVSENSLDESTAVTSTAQYATWGVDPADSGNAIVNILESQVFNT